MTAHDTPEQVTEASDVRWFVRQVMAELRSRRDVRGFAQIARTMTKILRHTKSVRANTVARSSSLFERAVLLSASSNRVLIRPAPDFDEHAYLRLYPDVREGVQAGRISSGFAHYVQHGRREARNRPYASNHRDPLEQRTHGYRKRLAVQPLFVSSDLPLHFGIAAGTAGTLVVRLAAVGSFEPCVLVARGRRQEVLAKVSSADGNFDFEFVISREPSDWTLAIVADRDHSQRFRLAEIRFTPSAAHEVYENADYFELLTSGVFDPVWYRRYGYDLSDELAFEHFYFLGRHKAHQPSLYFDPDWYTRSNADVRRTGYDPLLHFIRFGEREGRKPGPLFDPEWYTRRYRLRSHESALADYMNHRAAGRSPCAEFDSEFYLQHNPDVQVASVDPVEHYILTGFRENRNPSPTFDTRLYVQRYLQGSYEQNPLLHYLEQGNTAGPIADVTRLVDRGIAGEIERFVAPGPDFEEWRLPRTGGRTRRAKVIAFYLPQFHAIPENDKWWGKGFTEWTNLGRAVPRCRGHYQPRVPRDLGFYDLTRPDTIRRQVELAKSSGLYGFCFYFYWFNKRRLLDAPLELFVRDESLTFPFCLMWANENWTRRWDGREAEILMAQDYDPDHDDSLVDNLAAYFVHPRYISIGGRPLFVIYRPDQVPNARARFAGWRERWRSHHGINPLFCMAQSFDNVDPRIWGLDGAVEFPPHQMSARCKVVPNSQVEILDPGFTGTFHLYDDLAAAGSAHEESNFPLVKTVAPSWDNDARRQGRGTVFLGSTPARYQQWLHSAIDYAAAHPVNGEAVVFINAWNEWAESAYLEPDVHFGGAYLNATARAVYDLVDEKSGRRILLVGHDAYPHGAQAILLSIARTMSEQFGATPTVLLMDGGQLLPQYQDVCRTIVLSAKDSERDLLLRQLHDEGYRVAIANTTVAGALVPHLKRAGISFISLIHELPRLIAERGLEPQARLIARHAEAVVFPQVPVRDGFLRVVGQCDAPLVVRAQGNYNPHVPEPDARTSLRRTLGIGRDARIILNVGYADLRKGFDLFVAAARQTVAQTDDVHFVWVGNLAKDVETWLMPAADDPLQRRFHHHPFVSDARDLMNVMGGADLFFLSSREDPFPTVLMEAYAAGLDLLAYDGAGGFTDFVRENGRLLSTTDAGAAAKAIREMLLALTPARIAQRSAARQPKLRSELGPDQYSADLIGLLDPDFRRVSVVVPNYNYGRHLHARLASIFEQTYPVFEIIVLDDASQDDSLEVIERVCTEYRRKVKLITSLNNSGSAFRQWRKGLEIARGDYIWIAEADDVADPAFLATLMRMLIDRAAGFGFVDSWQIDEQDRRLGDSYAAYCGDGRPDNRFSRDFVLPGRKFLVENLSVKNTILNVSAVVWRRATIEGALAAAADSLDNYKVAGDWRLYAEAALTDQPVAYAAQALNGHRRHSASITHALDKQRHLDEIIGLHRFIEQKLALDDAVLRTMRSYEAEIASQFGVDAPRSTGSSTVVNAIDE